MLHTFHIFAVLFFDCSRKALAFAEEFDVDFVSGEPQKPEHKPELLQLSWRAVHNKHTIITILTTNWIEAFPHIYKYPANEKMLKHAQFSHLLYEIIKIIVLVFLKPPKCCICHIAEWCIC